MLRPNRFAAALACGVALWSIGCDRTTRTAATTTPTAPPAEIKLGRQMAVDAPAADWQPIKSGMLDPAFIPRRDAMLIEGLQRIGQRSTDLPYAFIEQYSPWADLHTIAGRQLVAQHLADDYKTAFNPPSRAERPPSWRRSTVSAVRYDGVTNQFRFDATLYYDPPLGELHVKVAGIFDGERVLVFNAWSDSDFDQSHPGEVAAIRDSFRMVDGSTGAALVSPAEHLRLIAQVLVGLFVAAVIAVQVVVIRNDRQSRREAMAEIA